MKNNRSCPVLLKYLPHGLGSDIFYPVSNKDEEYLNFKKELFRGRDYEFVLLFNSRNIRRKSIPDTILAWKLFMDKLTEKEARKCMLLLHTQASDPNGTDLVAVKDFFCPGEKYNVNIFPQSLSEKHMNYLYNVADGVVLISSAEGWGLALTEGLLTGTPFIANVTGGMQDQMRFVDENGEWMDFNTEFPSNHNGTYKEHGEWAFPVYPNNLSVVGSPLTPYIYDDRCDPKEVATQMYNLWEVGGKERKRRGEAGRQWALSDEAGFTSQQMTDKVVDAIDELFDTWVPRENMSLFKDDDYKPRELNHPINY
jgi:glycosyltransferase involved in cell wall biosynthesis